MQLLSFITHSEMIHFVLTNFITLFNLRCVCGLNYAKCVVFIIMVNMNPCLVQGRHTYSQGCVINKRYASDQPWVLHGRRSSSKLRQGWTLLPVSSTVMHNTHTPCMLIKSMQDFLTDCCIPYSIKIFMILFGRVAIGMMLCICAYVSFFVSAIWPAHNAAQCTIGTPWTPAKMGSFHPQTLSRLVIRNDFH